MMDGIQYNVSGGRTSDGRPRIGILLRDSEGSAAIIHSVGSSANGNKSRIKGCDIVSRCMSNCGESRHDSTLGVHVLCLLDSGSLVASAPVAGATPARHRLGARPGPGQPRSGRLRLPFRTSQTLIPCLVLRCRKRCRGPTYLRCGEVGVSQINLARSQWTFPASPHLERFLSSSRPSSLWYRCDGTGLHMVI